MGALDEGVQQWRASLARGRVIDAADLDELEEHLRDQAEDLAESGLSEDEAFLIALKRLGTADRLTAEYAREHGDRLWKHLVLAPEVDAEGARAKHPLVVMIACAVFAALAIQVGRIAAESGGGMASWFPRNVSLLVLPVLAGYLAWTRGVSRARAAVLGGIVAILAVGVNVFPFDDSSSTATLVAIHLPVVLSFVVGAAYVGAEWRSSARRMDFIRFTGEWAIYVVLIALGGGVLIGLTVLVISPIAPESISSLDKWTLPSGGAAAVIVAAWLVEAKKSVIENIAPVLTAIFTPLFAVMLVVAAVLYAVVGIGREFDRDLLTGFDVLLLVVLGLVLYGLSARPETARAGAMDVIRLVAVVAALVLDALVLGSLIGRIGELGLTPNRVAAIGLNVLLIVNLAVTAWLSIRLLIGRSPVSRLVRWQTSYLPVFGVWAVCVVLIVPVLFAFV
ncbi:MAG: permease prefix domain 1-containing protein [Microbacterium sp.]|uniref:permease prefix domain 1-containing protein n=1 Tax=Microbacterium sp. TaxID=51671 RepID=UPI0027275B10|nr:permease prefix domain 1-containing protein [Microbacterium sp.]MDO8383832.1 permease prefix domain 1-containing protein [Microbacterium sp.]